MPTAWRICLAQHARSGAAAFNGEGARLNGGRWNSKGVAVAYGSATLSLAALETLVHADADLLSEAHFAACAVEWPDSLPVASLTAADCAALTRAWRTEMNPPPAELRSYGDAWVAARRTAILLVPSAIVPEEQNVLVNPAHPDSRSLVYGRPRAFAFDPRLQTR